MKCPFCRPWISEAVFAESQNFMAVYNIAPILPGHSLIVPKRHLESILDLSENELSEMMIFARKVTTVLLEVFHAEAFDWSVQDKEAAGQTISHLHLHMVPRLVGDLNEPGNWYPEISRAITPFFSRNAFARFAVIVSANLAITKFPTDGSTVRPRSFRASENQTSHLSLWSRLVVT